MWRVFEGHRAGEGEQEAALDASACEVGITGKAVHDNGSRGARVVEHAQDVRVRVTVVDDQRLVHAFGQGDVRAKASFLRLEAGSLGTEVIQSRFANPPNALVFRERNDFGERTIQ